MSEDKKLSAKELKALRRAAKVEARPEGAQRPQGAATGGASSQGGSQRRPSHSATGAASRSEHARGLNASTGSATSRPDAEAKGKGKSSHDKAATLAQPAAARPQLFSHLESKRRIASDHIAKDVHPTIFTLALRYSSGAVTGSNARCLAMLAAFKEVIRDYVTPQGTTLARNLATYLSLQISYLVKARPLSVGMGTAIRHLKREISTRSIDKPDDVLRAELHAAIDTFARERVEMSGAVIARAAAARVRDGDVVLVYAHSTTVLAALAEAVRQGRRFSVVVVDSRPRREGRQMLERVVAVQRGVHNPEPLYPGANTRTIENTPDLSSSMDAEAFGDDPPSNSTGENGGGIDEVTFVQLSGLEYVMKEVTKVFLGAHALLANGALYARAGTAAVAAAAHHRHTPCVVLCETYKFSDRVLLDSFVVNELGPALAPPGGDAAEAVPAAEPVAKKDDGARSKGGNDDGAKGGKPGKDDSSKNNKPGARPEPVLDDPTHDGRLTRLELLYDVTPAKFLTVCVSELGSLPTTAVPAALREQNRDLGV